MNLNDLINGIYRQVLATAANLKTTSIGVLVGLGYLVLQYRANRTLTSGDIEIAGGIALLGTVSKDSTHSGAPPKNVIDAKDGI